MRNYDFLLILSGLFVIRIIAFSGSYADAICLLGLLSYSVLKQLLNIKKVSNDISEIIKKSEELNNARFQELASEVVKVRNGNEAIKAAVNFNKR